MPTDAPLVIVSSDTHIGPKLVEQLRPYCPSGYLDDFDGFAEQTAAMRSMFAALADGDSPLSRNARTEGHHDVHARLRDLDADGVVGEVIFHGSQNGEPIPFQAQGSFLGAESGDNLELLGVGYHIYNEWLADFVSVEPERHVGLAQLPMWDIDAAVKEVEWARAAGLRGINFPAPKPFIKPYNDMAWEPFWSACEDLGVSFANHGGAGNPQGFMGIGGFEIQTSELSALSRVTPMNQLIFGGVFERHPRLRLVITELPGAWWPYTLNEFDSIWMLSGHTSGGALYQHVPRKPSEYFATNVYVGASFQSRAEAEIATTEGFSSKLCWGSDYPHVEGTWAHPLAESEEPMTHRALRNTFSAIPAEPMRQMLGLNAVDAFRLDGAELARVAARIGAPTPSVVGKPLDAVPDDGGMLSFRTFGPWS